VAVTAADVGHGTARVEHLDNTVQRRQPLLHELAAIGIAVERSGAAEEALVVVSPRHSFPAPKDLERSFLIEPHGCRDLPRRGEIDRTVLIGQDPSLLRGEFIALAGRVVGDISPGCLAVQPLADIAFRAAGTLGELVRTQRSRTSHCAV